MAIDRKIVIMSCFCLSTCELSGYSSHHDPSVFQLVNLLPFDERVLILVALSTPSL